MQAAVEDDQVEALGRLGTEHEAPAVDQRQIEGGNRLAGNQGLRCHGAVLSGRLSQGASVRYARQTSVHK